MPPSRPLALDPTIAATVAKSGSARALAIARPLVATVVDSTPPTGPTQVTATAQSTIAINASWNAAQDPESGVASYVFGIGTVASGTFGTLANVRYWQVVNSNSVGVSLTLDPTLTYYVSVYAVNGAGLNGAIVTSAAIHPAWQTLGQAGNVMQIQFAPTGLDANGNPIAGFTSDQTTLMSTFFNRMYPLLVQLYGPPAVSHTVTLVRDLRYHNSNIYIPSVDEIHMDDGFYPQLLTHELLHTFRDKFLLASDASWNYDSTLSGFEESFAQAVSYDAMNAYVAAYPNDSIVAGNTLWGSSNDWDYDFQNVPELRGTDFWSDGGGTGLYWLRYEMGAAAIRKIQIESPGFYARFNQEYYRRINASPATVHPTRALIVDIIATLVPQIEGMPAASWIDAQNIFYAQNVYGDKIFHKIQDYPAGDFYVFQSMYFMDTMSCGSEWACWDGTKWVYYDLNGSQGSGRLVDDDGNTVWSGALSIQPAQNPSDGYMGFGSDEQDLTTASTLQPWPGGNASNWVMNLTNFGLYRFDSSFVDAANNTTTSNSIYRVIGSPIMNSFSGVFGGIIGHKNGTIYIDHDGYPTQPGIPVAHGAFAGARSWTGVANARTGGRDSVPGRVFITFVDSDTGQTYHAQRNIDYGSSTGSQMFLFDFSAPAVDVTAPAVSITAPTAGASVSGTVSITANASDNVAVSRVDFSVDGTLIGSRTTAPYAVSWNANAAGLGSHTITATAYDSSNISTTVTESVTVADKSPPTVSITAPASGANVSGTVSITASASDNAAVSRVDFSVDGKVVASDTGAPYAVSWNANAAGIGPHTITATAYDTSNNSAAATVTVTTVDKTAPSVTLTAPKPNASVSGSVSITATASDNIAVGRVDFSVDGKVVGSDTSAPYAVVWNADAASLGTHTVKATAYDTSNNSTSTTSVSVKVVDATAPSVTITAPANGGSVSRSTNVNITASASDNRGVARVVFYVNNTQKCSDTGSPYSCTWSVPSSRNVTYTLRARAYDAAGNFTDKTITVTAR